MIQKQKYNLKMDNLAPIVLFVYNRLDHTKQTLEALLANKLANQSEIFIYSDAAKSRNDEMKVSEVREYIKKVSGFKKITIIQRERKFGLASNIIDGVTKIVNQYNRIIVLEDDLITSPCFLTFMNEGLELYKDEPRVASIHGYVYPIDGLPETFFIKGSDCWGWATWSDKWNIFEPDGRKLLDEARRLKLEKEMDFNDSYRFVEMLKSQILGKNDSWAIRWYASAFLKDMLTLYPGKSYVQNIGFDSQATHCKIKTNLFNTDLNKNLAINKIDVKEDLVARKKFEIFFKKANPNFISKVFLKIKKLFIGERV